MSNGQEDVSSQPLVIVRRRRSHDEEHHGGVWKIAYADFMTAMMAFFLVMWLINAADKKTIVQVAAYFNPMRLTDRFEAPKGLEDLNEIDAKQNEEKSEKGLSQHPDQAQKLSAPKASKANIGEAMDEEAQKRSASAGGKSAEAQKEEALFDNPGQLLDKLADEAKASQSMTAASPLDSSISDPFDRADRRSGKSSAAQRSASQPNPAPAAPPAATAKASPPPSGVEGKDAAKNARALEAQDTKQAATALNAKDQNHAANAPKPSDAADVADEAKAKKLQDDISSALAKGSRAAPEIEVKATSEGLLVSLLDGADFGMFEVGSAKPRPALVLAMSKVGDVLKSLPGSIVVRGHTDSRAYKNGNYDNWRLSAARAQMAYYMLVRGGIAETRFAAIEGRADRDPKIPSNREAPENRRIDILIKEVKK
ncbi:OmpA/MotB domain protein [Hyphomicrobium denitrificans ATCC 51888]|uniref:OmpA/MotB domain protein n=1 Tax=Hyphomicrobium denitrificans (strain ATCC 51888 / DSM 1869 / NCIMB 11706 / TK 0415) TaxID=582899 RepID=D8JW07_HYPDA|nr:MotB family protein [Hyphomicrobium denitrificans]ADJ24886.1 OmpA/MotB domain protein [Hyphomicrobium denitrificans ATCC 51888]